MRIFFSWLAIPFVVLAFILAPHHPYWAVSIAAVSVAVRFE